MTEEDVRNMTYGLQHLWGRAQQEGADVEGLWSGIQERVTAASEKELDVIVAAFIRSWMPARDAEEEELRRAAAGFATLLGYVVPTNMMPLLRACLAENEGGSTDSAVCPNDLLARDPDGGRAYLGETVRTGRRPIEALVGERNEAKEEAG
jgi:hypothetical protein